MVHQRLYSLDSGFTPSRCSIVKSKVYPVHRACTWQSQKPSNGLLQHKREPKQRIFPRSNIPTIISFLAHILSSIFIGNIIRSSQPSLIAISPSERMECKLYDSVPRPCKRQYLRTNVSNSQSFAFSSQNQMQICLHSEIFKVYNFLHMSITILIIYQQPMKNELQECL